MSIQTEINRIIQAKNDIIDALNDKGLNTPIDITLDEIASIIANAPSGDTSAEDGLVTGELTEYVNDRVSSVRLSAFQAHQKLQKISLPNVTIISNNTFYGCNPLIELNLPRATNFGSSCCRNCSSLVQINFPSAITIGALAFADCTNLSSVTIPANSVCTLANVNAFQNTKIENGAGNIYVPSNLVSSYKSATNWVTYANKIRSIT